MSALLPEGIEKLHDCPVTLFDAIRMALGFLGFDELPKEERPPRRIWLVPDEMRTWWTHVERRRKEKMEGGADEDGDYETNAAAKDLIR